MNNHTPISTITLLLLSACFHLLPAQTVNQNTGDLSLAQSAVTIPGPQGGYSIPLTYQAGISPWQSSSWLGLGWNLQAGAISRNTVKHPDDCARCPNP